LPDRQKSKIMQMDKKEEIGELVGLGRYTFEYTYETAEWPPRAEFARSQFHLEV
jgi:hypothetical protein